MKELMIALMLWIGAQTGYEVNAPPPAVVFMTPEEVSDICIDEGTLVPYVAQSCYKLHKHTIYMWDDFNVEEPDKVGVLVHELTHVLQLFNGQKYTLATMDALEDEANTVEEFYEGTESIQAKIQDDYAPLDVTLVAQADPAAKGNGESKPSKAKSRKPIMLVPPGTAAREPIAPEDQLPTDLAQLLPTGFSEDAPVMVAKESSEDALARAYQDMWQDLCKNAVPDTDYQRVLGERDKLRRELGQTRSRVNALSDEVQALKRKNQQLETRVDEFASRLNQEKMRSLSDKVAREKAQRRPVRKQPVRTVKSPPPNTTSPPPNTTTPPPASQATKPRVVKKKPQKVVIQPEVVVVKQAPPPPPPPPPVKTVKVPATKPAKKPTAKTASISKPPKKTPALGDSPPALKPQKPKVVAVSKPVPPPTKPPKTVKPKSGQPAALGENLPSLDSPSVQVARLNTQEVSVPSSQGSGLKIPPGTKIMIYVVKKGDSLWKISNKYGVSIDELRKTNNLKTSDLRAGQKLKIPTAKPAPPSSQAPAVKRKKININEAETAPQLKLPD